MKHQSNIRILLALLPTLLFIINMEYADNTNIRWSETRKQTTPQITKWRAATTIKDKTQEQINSYRIEINGKWGFINKAGEMVIEAKYDSAYNFTPNGLASVMLGRKWGFINETGEMLR